MQKKGLQIGWLAVVLLAVIGLTAGGISGKETPADDMCIPMGNIEIKAPDTVSPIRPSVMFPHSSHFDYSCKQCHHTWDGSEAIQGCMTSGCHDLDKAPERKKGDDTSRILYYKNAYHSQCIGCHKNIKARNQEIELSVSANKPKLSRTGPTGCVQCHVE